MKLLPRDRFSIQTHQPLSTVLAILERHIEAPRMRWGFSHNHPPYTGQLSEEGFEIRRIIHYRNSFLPQIKGRFETAPEGTFVHITMGLHPLVLIFMLLWGSIWFTAAVPAFLVGALDGSVPFEIALLFCGVPLAMCLIFWGTFWYEAKRSRRELTQIIQGRLLLTSANSRRSNWRIVGWIAWALFTAYAAISIHQKIMAPEGTSPLNTSPAYVSQSQMGRSCSQDHALSPYCSFSLVHSLKGHPEVTQLAISDDGTTLISGGSDKAIKVWDLQTGELQQTLQSDSGIVTALAIASDNHTIVSGAGDRMVRIWDATTPDQYPQLLRGHTTHDISHVKLIEDGKTILSGGYGEVYLWHRDTGELRASLPATGPTEFQVGPVTVSNSPPHFRLLDISTDGQKLLVKTGRRLAIWDLATDQQTRLPQQWFTWVTSAHFTPDAQTVVTTSYTQPRVHLKSWDAATGELKAKVLLSSARESWGYGDRLVLTNKEAITSTPTGLKIWNLEKAVLEAVLSHEQAHQLVMSSDGRQLIGITGDAFAKTTHINVWQRS